MLSELCSVSSDWARKGFAKRLFDGGGPCVDGHGTVVAIRKPVLRRADRDCFDGLQWSNKRCRRYEKGALTFLLHQRVASGRPTPPA